jgi:hypothetical protein
MPLMVGLLGWGRGGVCDVSRGDVIVLIRLPR